MSHWIETYPHMVYASVLLLDNRIENWNVGQREWNNPYVASSFWKPYRLDDYKTQSIGWYCKNEKEHEKVFNELAPKWFKQWKCSNDYSLIKPYERF